VLVMPDDEPSHVSARWTSQLEAAGFHTLDPSETGDELGVLPRIMALPHVFGAAMRRGSEIVMHYAMRGGLAEHGRIPCRASLTLLTSELLGPWAGRGLERVGCVETVSDEQLVFRPGRDPGETFDVVRQAFLSSGAEVAVDEADRARAYADHLRKMMRRAGLHRREVEVQLAGQPIPRQLTLADQDGATLDIERRVTDGAVAVTRVTAKDRSG